MVLPAPDTGQWFADVLDALHLPITTDRAQSLALWARSEGMPDSTFNWLAATDQRPGSTAYNSAGVQRYPSYLVGVQVVVDKLSSSLYRPILAGLQADSAEQTWQAVNASPWCKGCQGGRYPVALYDWLAAGRPAGGPGNPGPDPGPPNQTGDAPDSWDPVVRWVGEHHGSIGRHLVGIGTVIGSLVK